MSDPSLPWLAAGYSAAWILLGAYLYRLWRLQKRINRRLDER